MRRVGYPGEGGAPRSESEIFMIAGGNHTTIYAFSERLPWADFFGYFLVRRQESNISRLTYHKSKEENI